MFKRLIYKIDEWLCTLFYHLHSYFAYRCSCHHPTIEERIEHLHSGIPDLEDNGKLETGINFQNDTEKE